MPYVTKRFAVGELVAQKYLLLNRLGRGAAGEVFKARNVVAGNILALKLLVEQAGSDSELVKRFFREARAITRIGHPNIVSVFDAGYADAVPYIAMEYLGGESLAQTLDRVTRLPVPAVVAVMLKILDALAAAHKAAVVHRDLKPANVFLQTIPGAPPTVKLLDFGVAKVREEGDASVETVSGMILGTPDYLSPEQITGDRNLDGRSDLFAAGALMFELLTGRRPFHGATFVATTYRIVHEPPPSLAEAGGPDEPRLTSILARALCKQPDGRYASASELAEDVAKLEPDVAAREAALRDLSVMSSLGEAAGQSSGVPTAEIFDDLLRPPSTGRVIERFEAEPSVAEAPTRNGRGGRKRVRTWSDLPIMRKRRAEQPPAGNVRGAVLLAVHNAITTRYGRDVRDEIMAALSARAEDRVGGAASWSQAWYSLDEMAAYLTACNQVAVHGDADRWRGLGYAAVETDLLDLLRAVHGQSDEYTALRASLPLLAGLFDFGKWTLDGSADSLRIQVVGFAQTPRSLHDWLSGVIEHAARSRSRPYRVTVTRPAGDGSDAAIEFLATLTE